VRTLAERDGLVFVEGIKPRGSGRPGEPPHLPSFISRT
jgi:hypothetical protein